MTKQPLPDRISRLRAGMGPDIDCFDLAFRVRGGGPVSQQERDLIADLLEGNIKNPRHRPPTSDAAFKRLLLVYACILMQRSHPNWSKTRIAGEIGYLNGISDAYLLKAWRELEPDQLAAMNEAADLIEKSQN